ncbi:hypothetical protein SAMN05518872_105269 [Psychrobacillus sp. OK032]|nr:hypothetical protein SAMN05518872_105269 [Psychrobacillus sp. OK032]
MTITLYTYTIGNRTTIVETYIRKTTVDRRKAGILNDYF